MIKSLNYSSLMISNLSFNTHKMSNLLIIGSERSTFSLKFKLSLYLPEIGFAAAITEHHAFRVATIPALEILILYCSIAS